MLTLLQINVDATNGSNGAIARDIGSIALSKGWKSYIAYGRRAMACDSQLIRVGNNWEVLLHGVFTRLFDLHGLGSSVSTYLFLRKVKKIKPDIIHLHNIHGYFINYKLLFKYLIKENIPVVWTFHDCWPFTGHCGHFVSYKCEKWKKQCQECPAVHSYPSSLFLDNSKYQYLLKKELFTTPQYMHITTVSNWLAGLVKQSFFSDKPISVVYNGIDIESFRYRDSNLRVKYGLDGKFVLIAAAANWTISKGWNDYIKLSQMIPEDCVIVMLGVDEYKRKKLPKEIISIPRVDNKEKLAEYYSMADALLNLSYQETFGMTTAEAMSCGTPGISYNITACPEVLTSDTGIVVEPGNIEQIIDAIEQIKKKGKRSYSSFCRKRVVEVFDSRRVNLPIFDIYDELLKNKK